MNEIAIRRAWEKFVDRGDRPASLRDAVVTSWERSKDFSVATTSEYAPLISEAQAYRHRSDNIWLGRCAAPVLEKCGRFLVDANTMMILTDPTGVVIETKGDDRSIDAGREIHLECGGRWTESDIGTNAIGTALASVKPVQIHAAEHYCESVQKWTCAAAPIFHPMDGELLGVIDLSGRAETFSKHSLAFAVSAADQIQTMMAKHIRVDHWKLVRFYFNKRRKWTNDEAILVDRRGAIVGATTNAIGMIRKSSPSAIDTTGISAVRNVALTRWRDILFELIPESKVELVSADGCELGAVIILKQSARNSKKDFTKTRSVRPDVDIGLFMEELLSGELGRDPLSLGDAMDSGLHPDANIAYPSNRSKRTHALDVTDLPCVIIADDVRVKETMEQVSRAARTGVPILIGSDTGTGKELLARHAHAESGRTGPFIAVNCAALPANLIEAELFGYVDGAFTGARPGGAIGLAEQADCGTLFLDEIGDMPLVLQAVLLRLLDDWTVRPLGGVPKAIDVLLVSATNVDLEAAVADGRLRRDLYYRLNTVQVTLPRLSERSDFNELATHILHDIDPTKRIDSDALQLLSKHAWPGSIRELKSVLTRLAFNCVDVSIDADAVNSMFPNDAGQRGLASGNSDALQDLKRAHVIATHDECRGNVAQTARKLGVSRNTVYRFLGERKTK